MSVHYVPAKRPPTPDIMGAMLEAKVGPELIDVLRVKTNGGTQMRAGLNAETVGEYMQTLKDSDQAWPFPPVVVFFDGTDYWLADGFHRVAAMRQLERIDEIPADVRVGDRRAAVLYAAGANAVHGLRRTNADKRRAVEVLLRDEEWAEWSNVEIARRCAVSESSVRNIRSELERTSQIAKSDTRIGADGRTQNVSNIGANRPAPQEQPQYATVAQLEGIVRETAARWYKDETPAYAVSDMRAAVRLRGGGFWINCIGKTDPPQWREADLAKAIANVADEMAPQPAQLRPAHEDDVYAVLEKMAPTCDLATADPAWRLNYVESALLRYDMKMRRDLIEDCITDWLRTRQLRHGIEDSPANGEATTPAPQPEPQKPQRHAEMWQLEWAVSQALREYCPDNNIEEYSAALADMRDAAEAREGAFWTAAVAMCKRYSFTYLSHGDLAGAIESVAMQRLARPPEPQLDPAPVQHTAAAATVGVVPNIPMPNWEAGRQPDPEPESDLDCYDDESATLAAKRMNRLHTLKVRFGETIDMLDEFGDLTGRHTASLMAKRELANLIEILDSEMDALEKGVRGV